MIAANAAKSEVAVGTGGQAARVLGDAWREQRKIRVAATVQREFVDGAFVNQRRNRARLCFHQRLLARNYDSLFGAGNGQLEFKIGRAADLDAQVGRDPRRHPGGFGAGRVFAGRKQIKCKTAIRVSG